MTGKDDSPADLAHAATLDPRLSPLVAAGLIAAVLAVVLGGGVLLTRRSSLSNPSAASQVPAEVPTAPSTTAVSAKPGSTALTAMPGLSALPATPSPTAAAETARDRAAAESSALPASSVRPTASTPAALATSRPLAIDAAPEPTLILSIQVVAVNGAETVLRPGMPTPAPAWWERGEAAPEPLRQQLTASYLHFWDVRAQALATLDTSRLSEVLGERSLEAEVAAVERLRAAGQVQLVDVDHHLNVLWATDSQAAIGDSLVDRSSVVSAAPATNDAPTPEPRTFNYRMAYLLKSSNAGWRVVDAVRILG